MFLRDLFPSLLVLAGCAFSLTHPGIANAQRILDSIPATRITEPVNDADLTLLKGNTHPLAQPNFDRGSVSESAPTGRVMLVLRRSPAQEAVLRSYLASLQDSSSPNYRRWLTPAQFGDAFGVSDADLQTVEQWLREHGFKVEKTAQARNIVQFSGTMGQLESTFHTSIHSFEVNGERHVANVSDPKVPAALAPVVAGIAHLNDFHPQPQSRLGATGKFDSATRIIRPDFTLFSGTTPLLFADPADAATIYNTPNAALNPNYSGTTYDGSGVKLGIVGDSNVSLSDITNYRLAFLGETKTTANIPTIIVDGNNPGLNGDEAEGLLDNEIAGGLAPKAKVFFYISSNTDLQSGLFDAIFRAIDDNIVSILSISFGECEANLGAAVNSLVIEMNEQAAAQGISVVVSSGDSGSAGCDSSASSAAQYGLAVNGLASSPFNIAVGGTDFDELPGSFASYASDTSSGTAPYYRTARKYIPENPWNDSTSASATIADNSPLLLGGVTNVVAGGGGASAIHSKPSFQTALTPNDSARDLPDVSLLAANGLYQATWVVCSDNAIYGADCQTSGGQFVDGTRFSGYGGTSTSAPAFAGILALVEQKVGSRLGQADYVLYQLAKSKYSAVFHDVTKGDNSVYCVGGTKDCNGSNFMTGFNALRGYDLATGLGSVNVAALVKNWESVALTGTTTSFSVDGSTAPVNVKHGTALQFNVAVTPPTASGVAGIADTANEISQGPQNNGQLRINLSDGTGSAMYNGLPGGKYTVYARYGGDATHAASSSAPAIRVTIEPEASSTALKVSAYNPLTGKPVSGGLSSVPYGSAIFHDAQIYGTAEGVNATQGLATGRITFADGGTIIGHAPVSDSNTASYPPLDGTFPAYSIGAHHIVAKYAGDPSFTANSSAAVSLNVIKAASSTTGSASSNSIPSVASTTLTVIVSAASVGAGPTGKVTLTANGMTLGTFSHLVSFEGTPAASQVQIDLRGSQLVAGSNTIKVAYSGDNNYKKSIGSIVINVSPSKFTLRNSGPLSIAAGSGTNNTAIITASSINSFAGVIRLTCAVTAELADAKSPVTCIVPSHLDITSSTSAKGILKIGTTAATSAGAYVVTVTGTDTATGKIRANTRVDVKVTAPAGGAGDNASR